MFSSRKINHGPQNANFLAIFFEYHFRDGLHLENESHFRSPSALETAGIWICIVAVGFHTSWEAASVQMFGQKKTAVPRGRIYLSAKQATGPVLLPVSPARLTGTTTSRWDRIVMVSITTAFPTLLAVAMLSNDNLFRRGRG